MFNIDQLDGMINGWFTHAATAESAFRLILAVVAGGLTGLEREHQGREAGFRTNILVCLGSTLAMLVSYHVSQLDIVPHGRVNITADPARIAYGIMAGIGFLGAGAIVRQGSTSHGLTTAANVWCMAALGLSIGLGMYSVAILCLALILLVLLVFHRIEDVLPRLYRKKLTVRMPWHPGCLDELIPRFTKRGYKVSGLGMQRDLHAQTVDFTLLITFQRHGKHHDIERDLFDAADLNLISATDE